MLGPGLEHVRAGSGKRQAGCAVVVLRDQRGDLQYLGNERGGGVLVVVVRLVATGCPRGALSGVPALGRAPREHVGPLAPSDAR